MYLYPAQCACVYLFWQIEKPKLIENTLPLVHTIWTYNLEKTSSHGLYRPSNRVNQIASREHPRVLLAEKVALEVHLFVTNFFTLSINSVIYPTSTLYRGQVAAVARSQETSFVSIWTVADGRRMRQRSKGLPCCSLGHTGCLFCLLLLLSAHLTNIERICQMLPSHWARVQLNPSQWRVLKHALLEEKK